MIAKVLADKNGVVECGFIPAYIEDSGNVVVKNRDNGGQDVLNFMIAQTDGADLGVKLEWSADGSFVKML